MVGASGTAGQWQVAGASRWSLDEMQDGSGGVGGSTLCAERLVKKRLYV